MCNCSSGKVCWGCKERREREKAERTSVNVGLCEIIIACCEQGTNSPAYLEAKAALKRHEEERAANIARFERRVWDRKL